LCYQHSYAPRHHGDANGEEKPDEPLGVVTEIAAIILLVAVHGFHALLNEHGNDLMDMLLHLADHPFVALKVLLKVILKATLKAILKTTILING